MWTEFGGKLPPEIRAKLRVSSTAYYGVLWVGFELFIDGGGT